MTMRIIISPRQKAVCLLTDLYRVNQKSVIGCVLSLPPTGCNLGKPYLGIIFTDLGCLGMSVVETEHEGSKLLVLLLELAHALHVADEG